MPWTKKKGANMTTMNFVVRNRYNEDKHFSDLYDAVNYVRDNNRSDWSVLSVYNNSDTETVVFERFSYVRSNEVKFIREISACESLGWNFSMEPYDENSMNEYEILLIKRSPLGEMFEVATIAGERDFGEKLCELIDNFNVEEHAQGYSSLTGKDGGPANEAELLQDAKDIKEMLDNLKKHVMAIERQHVPAIGKSKKRLKLT